MASDIRQARERLMDELVRLRAERDRIPAGIERERISGEILGVIRAMKVISIGVINHA